MKHLVLFICLLGASFFVACNTNSPANKPKIEKVDTNGPEYTSKYVCPMHCKGSGSDSPGVCPVCEMDYVMNDAMEGNHDGHDHGDHDGHNH